jgi:energy-coupling factor transporter ATP-binding protein EcfA2
LLSQVVKVSRLSNQQIGDAYRWFLEDLGLRALDALPTAPRPSMEVPDQDAVRESVRLDRIDTLQGVNALPSDAALNFGPNLTVIYGRNGAGKSGFARLLANACFSRSDAELLPNVFDDSSPRQPSALFHVTINGQASASIQYPNSLHLEKLRHIAVFDSDVARRHVSDSMSFEFRPAGFDVFHEMAAVQQALSQSLDHEVQMRSLDNVFAASFQLSTTMVAVAIRNLGPTSDILHLRALAQFGPTEMARLADLDSQIRAIETASPADAIARLRSMLRTLETLQDGIATAQSALNSERVTAINALIAQTKAHAETLSTLGTEQFRRPFFRAVGTPEWQSFVHASHDLAKLEAEGYPSADESRCLLCEQTLPEGSRSHIHRLFEFAQSSAQRDHDEALAEISREQAALAAIDMSFFDASTASHAIVGARFPSLSATLTNSMQELARLRDAAISGLEALTSITSAPPTLELLLAFEDAAKEVSTDIERLQNDAVNALSALVDEQAVLRDRQILAPLLPNIERFVSNTAWVTEANRRKPLLTTRPITDKEKALFSQLITGAYRDKLNEECEGLRCTLPVELRTAGKSGETQRSLKLRGGHEPQGILSEGEQTALALADFLTEISLNPFRGGIVLDDPVNSLDHERKQLIANRLVAEAHDRQVIVFTHDLVFLNQIVGLAENDDVDLQKHWIDRDSSGPGVVTLNDGPALSKDYDSCVRARSHLARANSTRGSQRERAVREGMGDLRRVVEEIVAKRLLKNVVPRWEDRIIVTALPKINWGNELADQFVSIYEDLSRHIVGHTHSEEAMGAPPEPSELQGMIERLDGLIRRARSERPSS